MAASTRLVALDPSHFPHILDEPVAWFIDFYANWCPPCKRMLPHFRKASVEVRTPSAPRQHHVSTTSALD